jgi:predicted RNA-binding protein with PIN domain
LPLLIDGHNLIGAGIFPDIHIADEDDEAKLVARLRVWKSRYNGQITVIFDRGIPGGKSHNLSGAGVKAIFAASPQEADDLIRRRIRKRPSGLVVVTNDEELRREAASYQVDSWRGEEFVKRMALPVPEEDEAGTEADVRLSGTELDAWEELFRRGKGSL